MLRVLQIVPNKGWAIDKLMSLVKGEIEIKRHYIDVDGERINTSGIDVFDYGLWCNMPNGKIADPSVLTVYHIQKGDEEKVRDKIKKSKPTIIIASCNAVKKGLKKLGFKSKIIPLVVPPQDFRVGYIGRNIPEKRFEIIDEACIRAGVKCCGLRRDNVATELSEKELMAWYRSLNVFVVATDINGEALTRIEALSVGTPVISTRIGTGIYKKGITWFDGSVDDLVKKINKMKPEVPITVEQYSQKYIEAYKDAFKYENFTGNSE